LCCVLVCTGKCDYYPREKLNIKSPKNITRYGDNTNKKYCSKCDKFIYEEKIRCECCGAILRRKPRNSKNRKEANNRMGIITEGY